MLILCYLSTQLLWKIREKPFLKLQRFTHVPFGTHLLARAFLNSQHSNGLTELYYILSTFPLISLCFISMRQNVSILLHQAYSKYIIYQIKKKIINWSKRVWLHETKIGITYIYIWIISPIMFFKKIFSK